ncbi:MAG TPA: peptidoglycan bridge formation glycyltransferase FemA/FemB family protein [Candidatus Limnocylindria bacterium]|nr:peptidoglycan bridge formation glycyltransferase FemA/FemB family protein [Candidatus Limnocylindria bacterium]
MKASPATYAEAQGWDELVVATGRPHILQSAAWAELKAATGWRAERYVLEDSRGSVRHGVAQVLTKRLPLGITVAYAPRGPLVDPAHLPAAIVAVRDALARKRCASLLCDPEQPAGPEVAAELARAGIRRSPVYVQPRRTLLMDLTREPDDLLAAMRKKTRQYIHKAERLGVVTEETTDLGRFLRVLAAVGARDRFALHSREYFERLLAAFGERAHLLMARVGDEDAGALLVVRLADRAWELYGGWSGAHAEARPFYLLKWRAMQRMRALGARRYDMWGLAEGAADPLAGVENFKLGFGGEVTEWVGALEIPVRPLLYPLWQLAARRRLARSAA